MAIAIYRRYFLVASIIFLLYFCYIQWFSRLYIGNYGHLESNQAIHRRVRGTNKSNGTTGKVTLVDVELNRIKSTAQKATSKLSIKLVPDEALHSTLQPNNTKSVKKPSKLLATVKTPSKLSLTSIKDTMTHSKLKSNNLKSVKKPSKLSAKVMKNKVSYSTLKSNNTKSINEPSKLTAKAMKNKVSYSTLKPNSTKSVKKPSKLSAKAMKNKISHSTVKLNNTKSIKKPSNLSAKAMKHAITLLTLKSYSTRTTSITKPSNLSVKAMKHAITRFTLKSYNTKSITKPSKFSDNSTKHIRTNSTLKPGNIKSATKPSKLSTTSMKHELQSSLKRNNVKTTKKPSKLSAMSIKHTVTHSTIKSKNIKSIKKPSKPPATLIKSKISHSKVKSNNTKSVNMPYKTTHSTTLTSVKKELGSSKVILLWTNYYTESHWKLENDFTRILPMGRNYFRNYCPQYDCYLTTDKQLYNYSHAIVFHDRNILYKKDKTMPLYRSLWQRWIYYNIESPRYVYSYQRYAFQNHHAIYNWSMTYMNSSNIDARYGYVIPRIQPTRPWIHSWSIDYHGRKRHLIAWLVSHCLSQRLKLVVALKKHIQVDIYGTCGTYRCQHKSNYECWKQEIIQYKFYLAFENSICTDYVTEKFWYPLRFGIIPVVLGGSRYKKIAPPHSYIDVNDFSSLTALANYLYKVANDKELYNSYMKWRDHWEVMIPRHWCNLCSALYHNHNSTHSDSYRTYNDDFGEHGVAKKCQKYPILKD